MQNLHHQLPIILEENGGTSEVQFKKQQQEFKPYKWNDFYDEMEIVEGTPIYCSEPNSGPIILLIHGAGHSALSFALLVKEIRQFATCISYDIIGHGLSARVDELSDQNLLKEAQMVLKYCFTKFPDKTVIIVGHSLGGAITCKIMKEARVRGIIIIDMIEKKAINSIPLMETMLRGRPVQFDSYQGAINYHLSSGILKNYLSAKITVPSYIDKQFKWKVDILAQQRHWKSWFEGMQDGFDSYTGPKTLLVADMDRIKAQILTSNYSVHILEQAGHSIHEDEPRRVAHLINLFILGQRIPTNVKEMIDKEKIGAMAFRPKIKQYILVI